MNQKNKFKFFFVLFAILFSSSNFLYAEDEKINGIVDQIQIISQDLKTLEKAVYKSSDITSKTLPANGLNEEILPTTYLITNQAKKLV